MNSFIYLKPFNKSRFKAFKRFSILMKLMYIAIYHFLAAFGEFVIYTTQKIVKTKIMSKQLEFNK